MTVTFFLLRHAAHDNLGRYLAGRLPGVHLGEAGRTQAARLAQRMKHETFAAIHVSPRERAQETAEIVAAACGIESIVTEPDLDEIDFGEWQGQDFASLESDPAWRKWNSARSMARTRGGETMLDVERRAMGVLERATLRYVSAGLAIVSHSEVIKAIVSHVLGLPIDAWSKFEVAPASVSTIVVGDWGAKLLSLNEMVG